MRVREREKNKREREKREVGKRERRECMKIGLEAKLTSSYGDFDVPMKSDRCKKEDINLFSLQ